MNVGSILNNDLVADERKEDKKQEESTSSFRHPSGAGIQPLQPQTHSSVPASIARPIPTPIQGQLSPSLSLGSRNRVSSHSRSSIVSLLNSDPEPKRDVAPSRTASSTSLNSESAQLSPIQVMPIASLPEPQVSKEEPKAEPVAVKPTTPPTVSEPKQSPKVESESTHTVKESSRKALIDAEIEEIKKLKSTRKPKRYQTPPIWAQEWIPPSKFAQHISNGNGPNANLNARSNDAYAPSNDFEPVRYTDKRVFDPSKTSSVDLECCITGVIPPPSVTRTIAEWIYANFLEIPDKDRKNIELELKFGTIIDKSRGHRLNIDVSTECIYNNFSLIHFEPGVHEDGYNELIRFLDELEKGYQDELVKMGNPPSKPRRKFNKLESDITDTYYRIAKRGENPKKIRISKDNLLDVERLTAINKVRISDLYIHNPSSLYDLRLSLSYEFPVPSEDIESIDSKNKVDLVRIKKRQSWTHKPTATKFDLTRVLLPVELKNNRGNKIVEHDQKYEVELEINTIELFNGFDQFKSGQNDIRFEELVEVFVNNARAMNNRVTKFASK